MTDGFENASAVRLGDLRRYLSLNGWTVQAGPTLDIYTLSELDSDPIEIGLPREAVSRSARTRIDQALRSLSQLEDRDVAATIYAIRSLGADIVRSRLPDAVVMHDSVHLETAVNFMNSMKNLLAAAATSELNPARFFGRVRKEAKVYTDACRFGHTFRGSFGFTIESPITPNLEPTLPGVAQHPPFERRVIQRVARGLSTLQQAVDAEDPQKLTTQYELGLSANMCDDLVDAVEAVDGSAIDLEFSFSPEWQVPVDIGSPKFQVRTQHIEMAREAAKLMRQQELIGEKSIRGLVTILKSEQNPSDLLNPHGAREVTIHWDSEDFGRINVRVLLRPDQYLLALEAHRSGRLFETRGVLEHKGKVWRLTAV